MSWTQESINKVLREIQESIPREIREHAVREVPASPTIEFIVDKLLESDTANPELKRKLQTLKEDGVFSKKRVVEDKKKTTLIKQIVSRKINKAIKEGRLPNKAQLKKVLKNEQV